MTGHQGFVLGCVFSPGGERLHTSSIEGDIHVWDPGLRSRLEVWSGCHQGPILGLTAAGNGEIFSAGLDGTVGVWSPEGECQRRLSGHRGGVHGVAVTESLIASASADRRVAVWQRGSGELVRYLDGHEEAVTSVAFLNDRILLTGSRDRSVRLWDLQQENPARVFEGHRWWVTRVAPVAGGRFVSCSEDATLRLWDPDRSEPLWIYDESPGPIWGLAVHPDGNQVVVGYGGDTCLVDLDARRSEPLPKVAPVSARAICFNADGSLLALGADHGDVDLLDMTGTGGQGKLAGNGYPVLSGVVRSELLVTGRVSGAVASVSATDGVVDHDGHGFFTYCCRYAGDGRFATGGFDQQVRLWHPGRPTEIAGADHGTFVFSLDLDPQGDRLMAAGGDRISVLALPDLRPLWRLEAAGVGSHLVCVFSSDGRIAGVGEAPVLKVWADGREVAAHPLPDAHSCVIEAVPGENAVVVGSAYGRISLVSVDSGDCHPLHGEHEDWIRVLRISPDGQRIFSASQNGSARLYDRSVGRVVDRFDFRPTAIGDFDEQGDLRSLDCLGVVHADTTID